MPTVKPEPPQLFHWFKLPFSEYTRAQKAQAAADRKWRADERRREAFARAQQGGN